MDFDPDFDPEPIDTRDERELPPVNFVLRAAASGDVNGEGDIEEDTGLLASNAYDRH
jgi:hypothetical protein